MIPCESSCLVETAGVAEFIAMHAGIVANAARCWLDLTSHGLTPVLRACGWGWSMGLPPTIVLVDSLIPDLTLFWNLRLASDSDIPTWVTPIPSTYASDPVVLTRLKEWLLAFEVYQQRPNFCRVVSASVPIAQMATFADRLKEELKGTHIQHVDPQEPPSRLPLAIASESSRQLTVELSRRTLAFQAPTPVLLEGTSRGAWMVELLQDVQTSRAVNELVPSAPHIRFRGDERPRADLRLLHSHPSAGRRDRRYQYPLFGPEGTDQHPPSFWREKSWRRFSEKAALHRGLTRSEPATCRLCGSLGGWNMRPRRSPGNEEPYSERCSAAQCRSARFRSEPGLGMET